MTISVPTSPMVSRGTAPVELRDAAILPFTVRVEALWLCEGDSAQAAQLLRVTEASLMASFKDGNEAAVAWCERPFEWLPEHSLAGDCGAQVGEGLMFEVRQTATACGAILEGWLRPRAVGTPLWVGTYYLAHDSFHWKVELEPDLPPSATNAAAACRAAVHRRSLELLRIREAGPAPELEVVLG